MTTSITRILELKFGDEEFRFHFHKGCLTLSYCGKAHRLAREEADELWKFLIISSDVQDPPEPEPEPEDDLLGNDESAADWDERQDDAPDLKTDCDIELTRDAIPAS